MKIKPRPALYFLIPYLLGIIAGRWTSIPFLWLWLSILFSFIGSVLTRNQRRYLSYGLLHLAVFAGGMLRFDHRRLLSNSGTLLQRTRQFFRHYGVSTPSVGKRGMPVMPSVNSNCCQIHHNRRRRNFSSDSKNCNHSATVNT